MRVFGFITAGTLAAAAVGAFGLAMVAAIPDVRRYLRIRKM